MRDAWNKTRLAQETLRVSEAKNLSQLQHVFGFKDSSRGGRGSKPNQA